MMIPRNRSFLVTEYSRKDKRPKGGGALNFVATHPKSYQQNAVWRLKDMWKKHTKKFQRKQRGLICPPRLPTWMCLCVCVLRVLFCVQVTYNFLSLFPFFVTRPSGTSEVLQSSKDCCSLMHANILMRMVQICWGITLPRHIIKSMITCS